MNCLLVLFAIADTDISNPSRVCPSERNWNKSSRFQEVHVFRTFVCGVEAHWIEQECLHPSINWNCLVAEDLLYNASKDRGQPSWNDDSAGIV